MRKSAAQEINIREVESYVAAGLTQKQIAEKYGVSESEIYRLANIIDIVNSEMIPADDFINIVGEISDQHDTEKEFVTWLIRNKHVLEEVIGIVPNEKLRPQVNTNLFGTGLRPDIVYRTEGPCLYIVEVKNTTARYPSQAMTAQVSAIGQLLLYKAVCGDKKNKLFLVDTCIHKETVMIVQQNKLPIGLIQAKNDRWISRCAPDT